MTWKPKRPKNYPHFDRFLSEEEAVALACDPARVAAHAFFPFIEYKQTWKRYTARKGKNASTARRRENLKTRKIRYAARSDAYIFEYYRHILSESYEERLLDLGIGHVPIAYRKLEKDGAGKSNIEHAFEAIEDIKSRQDCVAIALDISSFFENLDHRHIYDVWCSLLGQKRLPEDHYSVYKAITRYRTVDRKALYERLGITGERPDGTYGFLKYERDLEKQICSIKEFREKVCGEGGHYATLVSPLLPRGVPQGAPLSDLIANFYLLDFDCKVARFCDNRGFYYRRYSDDILIICDHEDQATSIKSLLQGWLSEYGSELIIKPTKTRMHKFEKSSGNIKMIPIDCTGNFEYLGFQFDGAVTLLRNSTMSNFYRKLSLACFHEAKYVSAKLSHMSIEEILYHKLTRRVLRRFGQIKAFETTKTAPKDWTFYTYVKRARRVFRNDEQAIARQVSGYKNFIRKRLAEELRSRGMT